MQRNKIWILSSILVVFAGVLVYGLILGVKNSPDANTPPVSQGAPDTLPPKDTETGPVSQFPYGQAVIHLDEIAQFPGLTVKPIRVVEDSRCPTGVQCIQAGRVRVEIEIKSGLGTSNEVIELGKFITTEAEKISLVSVEPYPESGTPISPDEYHFTFEVVKRSASATPVPAPQGACYRGGCSGQICSDNPDVVSTCEFREEYACYQSAVCERQSNGQCGWTETAALRMCLNNAS